MLQTHCDNAFQRGFQAAQYTHCKLQDIVHQPSAVFQAGLNCGPLRPLDYSLA